MASSEEFRKKGNHWKHFGMFSNGCFVSGGGFFSQEKKKGGEQHGGPGRRVREAASWVKGGFCPGRKRSGNDAVQTYNKEHEFFESIKKRGGNMASTKEKKKKKTKSTKGPQGILDLFFAIFKKKSGPISKEKTPPSEGKAANREEGQPS